MTEKNRKYTFIDLFAGCGGLSLGMEYAGFKSIFFNEIVPVFAATYLFNRDIEDGHYYIEIDNIGNMLASNSYLIDTIPEDFNLTDIVLNFNDNTLFLKNFICL